MWAFSSILKKSTFPNSNVYTLTRVLFCENILYAVFQQKFLSTTCLIALFLLFLFQVVICTREMAFTTCSTATTSTTTSFSRASADVDTHVQRNSSLLALLYTHDELFYYRISTFESCGSDGGGNGRCGLNNCSSSLAKPCSRSLLSLHRFRRTFLFVFVARSFFTRSAHSEIVSSPYIMHQHISSLQFLP